MNRDYGAELDALKEQLAEIKNLLGKSGMHQENTADALPISQAHALPGGASSRVTGGDDTSCVIYFSGRCRNGEQTIRYEPREKRSDELLALSGSKAAKVLSALGHKQRLDLLLAVWNEALTGAELVERLNMGTTGQLYHHLKALTGADLLVQEERGGRYTIPQHRRLPLMLLLSATSELIDTGDYIELAEARNEVQSYLGTATPEGYDVHHLLWAAADNTIQEHAEGYCSEMGIYVHDDGSVTIADNGRGIPTRLLPQTGQPVVQSVLTKLDLFGGTKPSFVAPGAEKGMSIAIVNALSRSLSVEIRRDGNIYRQQYRHGIPQTGLLTVGQTNETGTSVTFSPDPELFAERFGQTKILARVAELNQAFPQLNIQVQGV